MTKYELIKSKNSAVEYLCKSNTKHITPAQIKYCVKNFNLSKKQVETAYRNFLNFDKVDLRYKNIDCSYTKSNINFDWVATIKKRKYFKKKDVTSKEFGALLHEYIFNSNKKMLDFLEEKEFCVVQYYKILKDFSISGKLLGRKVLDFSKYKKINVNTLISFAARYNRNAYRSYESTKKYCKKYKIYKYNDVIKNKSSYNQYVRAMHILDLYL